jgi:hypothetical protein
LIIFPNSFALSAAVPLTHARIGYHTYTKDLLPSAVTVSGETAGGPKDAPLRPDTAEFWEPPTLPATWQLDLGALVDVDWVGIAAHTIGSKLATLGVKLSEDTDFDARVLLPGTSGNYASTPDSAALDITADIDIRIKVACSDWTPSSAFDFLDKITSDAAQFSYMLRLNTDGTLVQYWTEDGSTLRNAFSTVAVGAADGTPKWVRSTLDVNNGAAGRDIKFYTSDDGLTWTQLGTTVTQAGTTSIFSGTASLHIGGERSGVAGILAGKVYYAELRNGIGGAVVAKFDPANDAENGDTSFVSSTGETWTINQSGSPAARLINPKFGGEVAPAEDAPLMFLDALRTVRHLQLELTGSNVPRIAVVYLGKVLAMQRSIYGGHSPITLSRETLLKQPVSRGGQFLGQSYRRLGVSGSAAFRHLTAAWYRSNFDPFVKEARKQPYFFAWRPLTFPFEVGYVWTPDDIRPTNMGVRDFMEVSWNMTGIGNE